MLESRLALIIFFRCIGLAASFHNQVKQDMLEDFISHMHGSIRCPPPVSSHIFYEIIKVPVRSTTNKTCPVVSTVFAHSTPKILAKTYFVNVMKGKPAFWKPQYPFWLESVFLLEQQCLFFRVVDGLSG
jgi:hypothetical protein